MTEDPISTIGRVLRLTIWNDSPTPPTGSDRIDLLDVYIHHHGKPGLLGRTESWLLYLHQRGSGVIRKMRAEDVNRAAGGLA